MTMTATIKLHRSKAPDDNLTITLKQSLFLNKPKP